MTDTRTLPHDPYIEAVVNALTEAGMEPADAWTSDAETRGLYQFLNAVITLTPEDSGIDAERWPNGLIVSWEWHTGIEPGEPERGASWEWAKVRPNHGGTDEFDSLPVPGWVAPEMLAATVAGLAYTDKPIPMASTWHDHLRKPVQDAVEAWGVDEGAES